ncbi:thiamine phosphate synthase [Aureimonas psammosilenae]|uniref:thiamine phosphate synthase n=1 Tax=Aureimonas psammosilenae TaxID=2495496 RepID=UPI001F28CBF0|nr:thiamine phosphate synthase [Aureimonas psammosilenae]
MTPFMRQDFTRPRLVLVTTPLAATEAGVAALRAALGAGDVASVILDPAGRSEAEFQPFAEEMVAACRDHEVAVVVADETRVAGRAKADGMHLSSGDIEELRDTVKRLAPRSIVGASGFETRHEALEAGEALPDYLFFGQLGADTAPGAREEDMALAEWWAEIVEVPCILLGGADLETLPEAVRTGAEFVALASAVFADADPASVAAKVLRANEIIDDVSKAIAS